MLRGLCCSVLCLVAQSCPTLCDPMDCTMSWFLFFTISRSMSIELAMPPNHLILCHSLLLLLPIFPSIRVFISESVLHSRWPKYWSLSFSPSNECWKDWLLWSPWSPRDSQESSPTPQFKSISSLALSFLYSPALTSIHDHWENHSLDSMDQGYHVAFNM